MNIVKTVNDYHDGQIRREVWIEKDGEVKRYAVVLPDTATEEQINGAMGDVLRSYGIQAEALKKDENN